jgi:hypothetical protein
MLSVEEQAGVGAVDDSGVTGPLECVTADTLDCCG